MFSVAGEGQSFPKPPDVPNYVAQPVGYAAGTTANVDNPNDPPGYATELPDIPTTNLTNRVITAGGGAWATDESGFCTLVINGGPANCTEQKFRTHINCSHVLKDDPERNYGQPGASHAHLFCGNMTVNAFTTYAKLRDETMTTAGGDTVNSTAYWFPCFVKNGTHCIMGDFMIVYYSEEMGRVLKHLTRGQRYVSGTNMDDPDDTKRKREVYLANQQPGTSGRYSYGGDGFVGYICSNGSTSISPTNPVAYATKVLKNADGSDPWNGACKAGYRIYAEFNAPACWDGVNIWSPGSYDHFRQTVKDNLKPGGACPQTGSWVRVPVLSGKLEYTVGAGGFADYGNWRLASDDMMEAKLNSLPVCNLPSYSNYPCRESSTPVKIGNGRSFHFDWFGGWDGQIFLEWQHNCVGTDGFTGHQCNDSIFSASRALVTGGNGPKRAPQVDVNVHYGTDDPNKMVLIPTTTKGPKKVHVHQ
jgi:hypothetical protein